MVTNNYRQIIEDIESKKIYPIYLLMGEESFFVDEVSKKIQETILTDEQRIFDESVVYGKDINVNQLLSIIKRFPSISDKHLIIVKNAQDIKDLEKIETFLQGNLDRHILVLCFSEKSLDKRKKIFKLFENRGIVFESKKLYEKDVINWINEYCKLKKVVIDPVSCLLLVEFLGVNLYKIKNELDKLLSILNNRTVITTKDIQEYIGINNEYNIFQLQKFLNERNERKVFEIISFFGNDPKKYPLVLILSSLNSHFRKILIYLVTKDRNETNLALKLGINIYFIKDYKIASQNYNIKKCINAIEYICKADMKLKGFGVSKISEKDILKELMFNILK